MKQFCGKLQIAHNEKIWHIRKGCDIFEKAETFGFKHLKKNRVYDTMNAFASPILGWSGRTKIETNKTKKRR